MKFFPKRLFAVVLAVGVTISCQGAKGVDGGAELLVDNDPSAMAFPTLQSAIDAACSGDTIIVNPGTYKENITITNKNLIIQRSALASGAVILDGCSMGSAALVSFDNQDVGNSVLFIGIEFRNGSVGGAEIFNAFVRFEDCTFRSNSSLFSGGAVFVQTGLASFDSCSFISNITLGDGGAISSDSQQSHFNSSFTNNISAGFGGAIAANGPANGTSFGPTETDVTLVGCLFEGNLCGEEVNGGAISAANSDCVVADCTFLKNEGVNGGAIELFNEGNSLILNTVFDGNVAAGSGGVVANIDTNLTMVNCTLTNNSAGISASTVAATPTANTAIANSILFGNGGSPLTTEESGGGSLTVVFSVTQGGFDGEGNIDADPLFVDPLGPDGLPSTGDEDLSLQAVSPAIDAGNNNLIPADLVDQDQDGDLGEITPFDILGNNRVVDLPSIPDSGVGTGPIVDMGAFEFFVESAVLPGDVNMDGLVNLLDIEPFVELLSNNMFQVEADVNGDDVVNLLDIEPFIALLSGG